MLFETPQEELTNEEVPRFCVRHSENYGVYYILKSMEQGPSFRVTVPKYPARTPITAFWRVSATLHHLLFLYP